MKRRIEDLAFFGGSPLYADPKPIGQLAMPDVEEYLALIKQAFDKRRLTNGGPIVRELEVRLCSWHGVKHCVALANAGLGLIMLMQHFSKGQPGEVIMPSFTYRGLPHIAQWAGQTPRFCDVDKKTHTVDLNSVKNSISEKTTSILGVCNFNSPGDVEGLSELGRHHDVPVFFDSVDGTGSSYKGSLLGSFGEAEVFSLHATKMINGFEGGYVTTNNDDLAGILRWQRNFAIPVGKPTVKIPSSHVLGINAKLNELHAAMALLSLSGIDETILRNLERYEAYRHSLRGFRGVNLIPYPDPAVEKSNYRMAVIEIDESWPLSRDEMHILLQAEGAAIHPYYSPPLHRSDHCPPQAEPASLPVTEMLADRYLQLPVGELVSLADIRALGEMFHFISNNAQAIRRRLDSDKAAVAPPVAVDVK